MSFWWMQPGWKSAMCSCGVNIWNSGGDPDHGVCYDCFMAQSRKRPEPPGRCDICGAHEAVTGANGFGVCSEECMHEAERRAL